MSPSLTQTNYNENRLTKWGKFFLSCSHFTTQGCLGKDEGAALLPRLWVCVCVCSDHGTGRYPCWKLKSSDHGVFRGRETWKGFISVARTHNSWKHTHSFLFNLGRLECTSPNQTEIVKFKNFYEYSVQLHLAGLIAFHRVVTGEARCLATNSPY